MKLSRPALAAGTFLTALAVFTLPACGQEDDTATRTVDSSSNSVPLDTTAAPYPTATPEKTYGESYIPPGGDVIGEPMDPVPGANDCSYGPAAYCETYEDYRGTVYQTYLDELDLMGLNYGTPGEAVVLARMICDLAYDHGGDAMEPVLAVLTDNGLTMDEAVDVSFAALETC